MKKYLLSLLTFLILANNTFASENITGLSNKKLREGDINVDDIPMVILSAINFFIMIAGTISVIFIIIGGYKYLFGSLEENTDKGKDTIFMALIGFIISACSWLIVKFIINNFEGTSSSTSFILNIF